MKKLALAVALIITCANISYAEENYDLCAGIGELAVVIMKTRQNNVPMSTVMQKITGNGQFESVIRDLVIEAYRQPHYPFKDLRRGAINSFQNKVLVDCYEAMQEKE